MVSQIILQISSRTIRKSSPFGEPELNAPGTFSHARKRGRIKRAVLPLWTSAALISFTILICSMNRPERAPARPERGPATLRSWQGEPPQMMSTGGSFAPSSFVMSPTWIMLGKCFLVTWMGNASISLAQTGVIPLRTAARGKPPIPSKREPMVSMAPPWRGRGAGPAPPARFARTPGAGTSCPERSAGRQCRPACPAP